MLDLKLYPTHTKNRHTTSHSLGKQVTQLAKYLTSVYVSGWQCSSTASTSNEPGLDVADYPYDTVPNKAPSNWDWICSYGQGRARPDMA